LGITQRTGSAERGTLVSVCGLLGLTLFKGAAGWLTGSKALLADACHSAADCAGSFISYMGLRGSRKSQVHSPRSESAPALVLSALLLVAGLEIGISSVRTAAAGPTEARGWGAVAAVAAGMTARECILLYKRRQDSKLGIRDRRPSQIRSDRVASLIALAGVSGTMAGDWLEMPELFLLDPAAGILVAALVLRSGYRLTRNMIRNAEQENGCEVDLQVIREAIRRIDGVIAVDDVKAREHGHYVVVDAVILVNPRISVTDGQDIAQRVRRHLTHRFLHIIEVVVQVQPFDPGYPYKSNHQDEQWPTLVQ